MMLAPKRAQPQHQKLPNSRPVNRPAEAHSADGGQEESRENNFLRACDFLSSPTLTVGSSISAAVPFAPITETTAPELEANPHRPVGDYTAPPTSHSETAGRLSAHRATCDRHITGRFEMKRMLSFAALFLWLSSAILAQTFNSGSTGADGVLDLTAGDREVQLPESGILNYTTVNIPAGRTLRFKKNSRNTPVYLLAQGSVTIAGAVDVSSPGRIESGPGGFYGGSESNQPGYGPGGGSAGGGHGVWLGPLSLIPIIGGSGSGVIRGFYQGGGGGGGAIVIASSQTITLSSGSTIRANGSCSFVDSMCGSGGAIRVVANSVIANGRIEAIQSPGGGYFYEFSPGVIRLEAPAGHLLFNGTCKPAPIISGINNVILPTINSPALTIVSIAGFAVPSATSGRPDAVDLMLPRQLTDPIAILVRGSNVPVGTQVKINISGRGNPTSTPATLSGTLQSSSATINVSGLDKGGAVTYLYVSAVFDLPQSVQNFNLKGRDEIAQVRVEAAPGAKPKYVFLRKDGSEVERGKVPPPLLQQFGGLE
jgi:hypothetical protein